MYNYQGLLIREMFPLSIFKYFGNLYTRNGKICQFEAFSKISNSFNQKRIFFPINSSNANTVFNNMGKITKQFKGLKLPSWVAICKITSTESSRKFVLTKSCPNNFMVEINNYLLQFFLYIGLKL